MSRGGANRKTISDFITAAVEIHGTRYGYDGVIYVNNRTKVSIICGAHGPFLVRPSNHLKGSGCPACKVEKLRQRAKDTDWFIRGAIRTHGTRYIYDETEYRGSTNKVAIRCMIHGRFEQRPSFHLRGNGCPKCAGHGDIWSTAEFVRRSRTRHGDKYDYADTVYQGKTKKITYTCPKHGRISHQTAQSHLRGVGCPGCANNQLLSLAGFVEKSRIVHGDYYTYEKTSYSGGTKKIEITCRKHGSFWQLPHNHLAGQKCPKCARSISGAERRWLDSLSVPEELRQKRVCLSTGETFVVDALDPVTNTIYEFWGDFWHGNPDLYDSDEINPVCRETFGALHDKTNRKRGAIMRDGYQLIEIWESDFRESLSSHGQGRHN